MTLNIINNKINPVPSKSPVNRDSSAKLNAINITYTAQNYPAVPLESLKAYTLGFSARKTQPSQSAESSDVSKLVKSVINKEFQGAGLYSPEGTTTKPTYNIQWSKAKWDNLQKEPIDWKTAKKQDVLAFWHALSLCEVQETSWVNKFSPEVAKVPLFTMHSISGDKAKINNNKNLEQLGKILSQKDTTDKDYPVYLNKTLIDPKTGKFAVDFTVFDTETTGVEKDDRILQIGAMQFKNGEKIPYTRFFDPEKEIPAGAVEVHHIDKKVLEENNAKPLSESLKNFNDNIVGNNLLVAYNAQFDIGKMNYEIGVHNKKQTSKDEQIKEKEICLTMDPVLLIQRIHPDVGVRKKLGEQYKFFFGKGFEGAHDAFNDVNATVDVLKYTALYLNKHFTPSEDKEALTVGDLLTFQFGGKVKGLNIELDDELKVDKSKTYKASYTKKAINADGFSDGCAVNDNNLDKLEKEHGEELGKTNMATLRKFQKAMEEAGDEKYSSTTIKRYLGKSEKFKIVDNNGNSSKKLIKLICEKLPNPKSNVLTITYIKNLDQGNPQNDLPDMEICRQVVLDKTPKQIKKMKLPDLS